MRQRGKIVDTKFCAMCGAPFNIVYPGRLEKKYCSKNCASRNQSKGLGWRFAILQRDNFRCQYCGRSPREDGVKLEVDHINPKSRGGANDADNYITACFDCNRGKTDTELINTL